MYSLIVSSVMQFTDTRIVHYSNGLSRLKQVSNSRLLPLFVIIGAPTLRLMLLAVAAFSGRIAESKSMRLFLLDFKMNSAETGLLFDTTMS